MSASDRRYTGPSSTSSLLRGITVRLKADYELSRSSFYFGTGSTISRAEAKLALWNRTKGVFVGGVKSEVFVREKICFGGGPIDGCPVGSFTGADDKVSKGFKFTSINIRRDHLYNVQIRWVVESVVNNATLESLGRLYHASATATW